MPDLIEKLNIALTLRENGLDDPEELINNTSIKNIQLLTHPIWWTTPPNLSPGEKITFFKRT